MKKQIQNFLAFLLIAFFAFTNVQAIDLSFNGDIEKLNGDKNKRTCKKGDQFLLGLSNANVDGKEISILLTLNDVKNDVSKALKKYGKPCIGFSGSYRGYGEKNLKFLLNNDTRRLPGKDAYIDANFTIIEKRDDNQHIPVEVDNVTFTAFDLDRTWPEHSDRDTIYLNAPQINLSEKAKKSWGRVRGLRLEYKKDVSDPESFGSYKARIVGRGQNCGEKNHDECKAGGTFYRNSTFSFKIQNNNTKALRLFVISFLEGEAPVGIATISDANATEGNVLTHSVTMTRKSTTASEFSFEIKDIETMIGDDYSTDYNFTNNVTYNETYITVPTGVKTFDIKVRSNTDEIAEGQERYNIKIKDKTAKGTIIDKGVPTVSMSSPEVTEGGDLVFDVNLSMKSTKDIYVIFSAQKSSTAKTGSDYESFSAVNWVKIPADTLGTKFTIHTKDDDIKETPKEYINLVGNIWWGETTNKFATAKGTIIDDDNDVSVESIESVKVYEGQVLKHRVIMAGVSDIDETYTFKIEDITTSKGDYNPTPTFSQKVKLQGDNIVVPAGTTDFYVHIESINDKKYEAEPESYKLSIGSKVANGTIKEHTKPSVLRDDRVSRKLADTGSKGVDIDILANDDKNINISTISLSSSVPGTKAIDTDGDGDIDKLEVPEEGTWTIDDKGVLNFVHSHLYYEHEYSPITYKTKDDTYNLDPATVVLTSLDIYDT